MTTSPSVNEEAYQRYSTAMECVETIKLALSSRFYKDGHVNLAIRPTHLLFGFALELYLKAWLLADGMPSKDVRRYGHKIIDLSQDAIKRGFPSDPAIIAIIDHVAKPHGQDGDYTYRYSGPKDEIVPLDWTAIWPAVQKLDSIVDTRVGASASHGLPAGRWNLNDTP